MAPVITKHPSSDSEGKFLTQSGKRPHGQLDPAWLMMSFMFGNEGEHESRARKKKRSSRWGAEDPCQKTAIPGMPTIIPSNMTKEQEKAYLSKRAFRIVRWLFFDHQLTQSVSSNNTKSSIAYRRNHTYVAIRRARHTGQYRRSIAIARASIWQSGKTFEYARSTNETKTRRRASQEYRRNA